jgi:metal-responsive CopG/Arc/MetJ family transcriptional regulator
MYDDKMRTIVDLPKEQIDALDRLRKSERVSRTALIRRAIEAYLHAHERPTLQKLPGFGAWKGKSLDGLDYQEKIRAEWER